MDEPNSVDQARRRMLRDQLHQRGITSPHVLTAMAKVPRHRFAPGLSPEDAYADRAWPIECGQTISQPYIVGLMTQALRLSGVERVLEVGTGSGYQAAVLAELAAEVITIERHAELAARAGRILAQLGYANVRTMVGDGSLGAPEEAPFDRIVVTAAGREPPPALWEQLAEGGILVMPLGDTDSQVLQALHKEEGTARREVLSGCRFVPLVGAQGWPEAPE